MSRAMAKSRNHIESSLAYGVLLLLRYGNIHVSFDHRKTGRKKFTNAKKFHVQMFTNGMTESVSSKICLRDVYFDAFRVMLQFMYSGEINEDESMDTDVLLLQLLLLADQFGVSLLHQECCKRLLEHLSEVLQVTVALRYYLLPMAYQFLFRKKKPFHGAGLNLKIRGKWWSIGLVNTSREDLWHINKNIDVSHLYITCRHGVLVEEDHCTSFCIMPSLMEEEADNFGSL